VSVPAAFIGVVLIWSTTPLAIKWSGEGPGYLFGVASRMAIGLFVCLVLVALLSRRMHWRRDALLTYLTAGLGMWGAMTAVYWGAQHVPSGLVSVLYGLTPLITAVLATLWLREQALTATRLLGIAIGITGLILIFGQGFQLGPQTGWGMAAILLSATIHSTSSVWVKRIGASLHPLETVTGSLMVAMPLFAITWLLSGKLPEAMPDRALWSIVYLGVVGSVLGFIAFYYILRRVQASRVALIPLITPVIALLLGQWANSEVVTTREWLGAAIILGGLTLFQWGDRLPGRLAREAA